VVVRLLFGRLSETDINRGYADLQVHIEDHYRDDSSEFAASLLITIPMGDGDVRRMRLAIMRSALHYLSYIDLGHSKW
jgi:hypothetical protein